MKKRWKGLSMAVLFISIFVFTAFSRQWETKAIEVDEEIELTDGLMSKVISMDILSIKVKITAYDNRKNSFGSNLTVDNHYDIGNLALTVDSIGEGVFNSSNTSNLSTLSIGGIKVEKGAVNNCPDLRLIHTSNTEILEGAFSNLPMLTEINLSSCRILEEGAFTDCTELSQVTFNYTGLSADSMSNNAFPGCTSVSKVILEYPYDSKESNKGLLQKIRSSLPHAQIEGRLWRNSSVDSASKKPELNKTELNDYEVDSEPYQLEITNLYPKLKEGMTVEGEILKKDKLYAKYQWISDKPEVAGVDENGLVTPHMPGEAVVTLKVTDGSRIQTAECKVNVTGRRSGDYEFDTGSGTIIRYRGSDSKVEIPDKLDGAEVKKIGTGAFSGREDITKVIIPGTVTEIGENAFKGCSKLNDVIIPGNIKMIEAGAFEDCIGLNGKGIEIPNSIEAIAPGAFTGVDELELTVLYRGETDDSQTPAIRHDIFEAAGIDDRISGYKVGVPLVFHPELDRTKIKDMKAGSEPVKLTLTGLRPVNLPEEINEGNSDMEPVKVIWKSGNPAVVQVSDEGLVTPVNAGSAVVSAVVCGKTVSCNVTVTGGKIMITAPEGIGLSENTRAVLARTEPVKSAAARGDDTAILMTFQKRNPEDIPDDVRLIEESLNGQQEAAAYYNIGFQALIDGRMPENMEEMAGDIDLTFPLDGITAADSYKVARVHKGKAVLLNAIPDQDGTLLKTTSSLFSTYAVIREGVPAAEKGKSRRIEKKKTSVKAPQSVSAAKTGDSSDPGRLTGLAALMVIAAFGVSCGCRKMKNR